VALSREVKVGAFVAAGLLIAGAVVFMIGDERRAFEAKERYFAVFDDVQGLTRGAPVRMGGVDVGTVLSVSYGEDEKDPRLHVQMDIVRAESRRIREDSAAFVGNKGLLGDKMIVIRVGDPKKPPLAPGSTIRSEVGSDFGALTEKLSAITVKADNVLANLEKTTNTFAAPAVQEDLKASVRALAHILKAVDEGDGYVARLVRDPAEAKKLSTLVSSLDHAAAELDQTLAGVNATIARVNHGPGFAHDVVYGNGPSDAVAQIGRAAGELATTLEGVRKGNGLARSLIYGGDDQTAQLIADLDAVAKDARAIVSGIRNGKGTLGALMVDPSVYEDLKVLLGNVERNKTLRALVRYSIQRDEKVLPVEIRDPEKSEAPRIEPGEGTPSAASAGARSKIGAE
jgi:phospholipid/cholesterol/gamma-HCH transport system substrate-binding protein